MTDEKVLRSGAEEDEDDRVYDLELDETTDAEREELLNRALEEAAGGGSPADSGEMAGDDGQIDADAGVDELQRKAAELQERWLRSVADFENYRKRIERERAEVSRYATSETLKEFLTVVDNLERALGVEASEQDLRSGVEMIHRQMLDLLKRSGAVGIEAEGEDFDPSVHEAVVRFEDPGVDRPVVREELQKGYKLHERLLRPSMVKVAVPAEET